MEQQDTIIIDVQIDTKKAQQELSGAIAKVAALKKEQQSLTKEIIAGNDADGEKAARLAEVQKEIETYQRQTKAQTAALQAATIETVSNTQSLDSQRQALNTLQKAYAQLSGEERAAADRQGGLKDQIKKLSDSVKAQEQSIGDARRNVGNYAESIVKAFSSMGGGASKVVNPIKNVTMGLKTMSATPVIAILGVLANLITMLSEKFRQNGAAMESLTKVFGTFEGVGQLVNKVIDKLAEGIGWLADKLLVFADKLGLVTETMKESQAIAQAELDMNAKQRANAKANAESAQQVAELRAKANEKDKISTKERLQLLQQAADIEEQIAKRNYELAKEQYDLQVRKNAQSNSSQEDLNKENELYVQMLGAQTAYLAKQRELNSQMAAERQKQTEQARQAAAVRLEIERQLEDTLLELQTDGTARQIAKIKLQGEREVENLRIKLNNLKQTDLRARSDMQRLIVAKEKETAQKVDAVLRDAEMSRNDILRQNEALRTEIETTSAIERARARMNAANESFQEIANLSEQEQLRIYGTQERYDNAFLQASKAGADAQKAWLLAIYDEQSNIIANAYEKRKMQVETDDVAMAELELQNEQIKQQRLLELDEETKSALFANQQEYELAVIQSNNNVQKAIKAVQQAELQRATTTANAVSSMFDTMSNALAEYGEENEEAAKMSKILALGKIGVDTGIAIANGVAQAMDVPFPANLAAIATTIATVMANIVTATKHVKDAKFAEGGIVGGNSYSGDNVLARVNSREMVITTDQQARLFDALNGGGQLGNFDAMQQAMSNALQDMPAPIMVYSEFESFQKRNTQYKEIVSL